MELFSRIEGSGQPFLILHGLFGMSDNWQTFGKAIAEKGYEVHMIDERNHGRSPHAPEHSYELMADDLYEYCIQHSLTDFILMGHSMGGKVAMVFAARFPQFVDKLLVIDIAPKGYPVHHQQILEGLNSLDFSLLKSRGAADKKLAETLPQISIRQFLLKSLYWKEKEQLALRFNLPVLEENIEMVGESLMDDAEYSGPTLFVRGSTSGYINDEDINLIHKHFPLAKLETIQGAGHWVHAEKPTEFYEVISTFVG